MRVRPFVAIVLSTLLAVPTVVVAEDDDEDVAADDEAEKAAPADDVDEAAADGDDEKASDDDEEEPVKKKKRKRTKLGKPSKKSKKKKKKRAEAEIEASEPAPPADNLITAPPRVTFTAELLGASPVDSGNLELFGTGGGGAAGIEIYAAPWLGIHAAASAIYLSKDQSMSSTTWLAGQLGPRVHFGDKLFGALTHNDAWVDAHVSFGTSGGIARPGFDAGAAVQWEVSPSVRLGPMVRYQFGSDPISNNAQLFTIGVAAGFGGRTRTPLIVPLDDDGDGVVNADDACRDEPAGEHPHAELAGCPDRDEDGIVDAKDKCPREAAGDNPDPERRGCPLPEDQDGDQIADDEDKCPTQAGPANEDDPSRHGCPELAKVVENKIEILQQIFFENDSATIKDESIVVLEAVAGAIKGLDRPRIRVEGHTDDKGTAEYNLDLSKRRARAVAQWLITTGGIEGGVLETEGYGKSRPLVSGDVADTSKNRRVEFIILRTGGK